MGAAERASGRKSRVTDPLEEQEEKESEESKRPDEQKAATYRIGQTLKERIDSLAAELRVEKTGLVKALLTHALDDFEAGGWELPETIDPIKRKLDI